MGYCGVLPLSLKGGDTQLPGAHNGNPSAEYRYEKYDPR
jgi:hypothetical protein